MKKNLCFIFMLFLLFALPIKVSASDVKYTQIEGTNYYTDSGNSKKALKVIEKAQAYLPDELLTLFEQEGVQIYYLENHYIDDYSGATYKPVCDIYYKDKEKKTRVRTPVKIYIYNNPSEYVLLHEYGHALDYIWGYKAGKKTCDEGISRSKSWSDLYEFKKDQLKQYRDYGLTNKYEGFAESFMFSLTDPTFEKNASQLNNYVKKKIQESKKLLEETQDGKSEKTTKR